MRGDGGDEESVLLMRRRASTSVPHETAETNMEFADDRARANSRSGVCNPANVAVVVLALAGVIYAVFLASVLIMESGQDAYQRNGNDGFHDLFLTLPSNRSAAKHLYNLTFEPHMAGTHANYLTADYVKEKFEEYGLKAHMRSYPVLLSYPIARSLDLVRPFEEKFNLDEPAVEGDTYSSNSHISLTFNAYSPSGTVEAEVVYANYGRTEDFDYLATIGINVSGAVVVTRYGQIYRGDKVANAALRGAVGVLIYSDPQEYALNLTDGEYPETRWLPKGGVQRGSIFNGAGDPLTPGWPSTEDGEYIDASDPAAQIPTIPSLPISRDTAAPILYKLGGPVAPEGWVGALGIPTHHLGRGPSRVRLKVEMNQTMADIYDVFGVIEGTDETDRYVLLGNHRDAWTFGAADPNSGTASLLEIARALGKLLARGWRPRRTIMLCSWDAEEFGLIGSVEWVEENADLLSTQAIAYLNVDTAVSGATWHAGSTPQLDKLLINTTRKVIDPDNPGHSIYDSWIASSGLAKNASSKPQLYRLGGGGTDHASFIQHVGVPGLDFFFGDNIYPTYHSAYDNFHWMSKFGDPGFHRHVAVACVWGLLGLRLADASVLPFDYTDYATELSSELAFVESRLATSLAPEEIVSTKPLRDAIADFTIQSRITNEEVMTMSTAATPKGAGEEALMSQRRRSLNDRLMQTKTSTNSPRSVLLYLLSCTWQSLRSHCPPGTLCNGPIPLRGSSPSTKSSHLNSADPAKHSFPRCTKAERSFLDADGLPGRTWYKHLVYGPVKDNGYGSLAFPSIHDAISDVVKSKEKEEWKEVQHQIFRVARAITRSSLSLRGTLT